jgi:tRNA(fMet)-specific endonuclease VapC
MTGSLVALDTNIVVALLNGDPTISSWLASFSTLCISMPVAGELLFGALNSTRAAENLDRVQKLLDRSRALETTLQTARLYAEVRLALKRKARPIPENDIWIAASAIEHGLPLATRDAHFNQVNGVTLLPSP